MIDFTKRILLLALLINTTSCARILGIFPFYAYSHFILGDTLLKELAARGHEVTMISPFPQKIPQRNYKDIFLPEARDFFEKEKENGAIFFEFNDLSTVSKMMTIFPIGYEIVAATFRNKEVQALINSDEEFDLIVTENFFNEALYGFGHKFKAPMLIVTAGGASQWINRLSGNPSPTSYIVNEFLAYTPNMTFYQRLHNTFTAVSVDLVTHLYSLPQHNALMHTYFKDAPHVYDLMAETSFILLNTYPGFTAQVPLMPNMKEVGGLHIKNDTKLPDDLKKFLDDSKEGVVLFALGSNLKSKDLPSKKLKAFLEAFKRWNKPILWKFEEESLPGKPSNVKIYKWLPQSAVLAHPNVKAFITHGGRLSTLESIYFGVPTIVLAVFAEQPYNAAQAVYAGYGLKIDFHSYTADELFNAMIEITTNPKYGDKAKMLSKAMLSRNALEESINWVEYVIEFKGAPHLRSYGVNLPFYQYLLIDVVLFVAILGCSVTIVAALITSLICRRKQKRKEKVK